MVSQASEKLTEARQPRLFVIDDEPSIRAAIRRFLTRRGWDVEEAEDGRKAMEVLLHSSPGHYDVVMCDLRMPLCSGAELHEQLLEKRPDLVQRLVFSTGDVASADAADLPRRFRSPGHREAVRARATRGDARPRPRLRAGDRQHHA